MNHFVNPLSCAVNKKKSFCTIISSGGIRCSTNCKRNVLGVRSAADGRPVKKGEKLQLRSCFKNLCRTERRSVRSLVSNMKQEESSGAAVAGQSCRWSSVSSSRRWSGLKVLVDLRHVQHDVLPVGPVGLHQLFNVLLTTKWRVKDLQCVWFCEQQTVKHDVMLLFLKLIKVVSRISFYKLFFYINSFILRRILADSHESDGETAFTWLHAEPASQQLPQSPPSCLLLLMPAQKHGASPGQSESATVWFLQIHLFAAL